MPPGEQLKHKRCFNHASREAAARCPNCKQDFCRECITEHAGKMLCVNCLKASSEKKKKKRRFLHSVFNVFIFIAAIILIYLCFAWMGRAIARSDIAEHASHNIEE
jgi:hypothetical protein